ncbi:MAG TPA: ClbS/DfsB family four-helix bundle protein [Ktedonobacteraceae bacterium]|jgi:hypothetical protein|nr:ClbS/DfsB family four-helix bundle protein [Ktedonobacteraceae bacterium]
MSKQKDKTQLLDEMNKSYAALEALLAPLSDEQMTTPGVNGTWSVKDNLAHLAAWQQHELARQRALSEGVEPPDTWPGLTSEDEENEYIYQQNKARSLADVRATLQDSHQQLVATVEAMSNEELNQPVPGSNERFRWEYIVGNSSEHYQEHAQIIRDWLARGGNAASKA